MKTMMESDIAAAVVDMSAVLYVGRKGITGTFGVLGTGDDIDAEGILATADAEFVATRSAFGETIPAIRSIVVVGGVKYYVQSMTEDDAAITLQLKRGP